MLILQAVKNLHVEQTLSYLTVYCSQEVKRHRELENKLVDHDEVSDSH